MSVPADDNLLAVDDALQPASKAIRWQAIRAQGAGGQHVNKSSSAVELRFDIANSGLPERVQQQLLTRRDQRVNNAGELIIKSQNSRSQHANKRAALQRLADVIREAADEPLPRKPTSPSRSSVRKQQQAKRHQSERKMQRKRPDTDGHNC